MNKIRVYIPTTDGPVAVERITREPAAQSAVCVKRTTRVLPISAAYDAFVRAPSGVIEREFGPFETGAFRLDVSAPISDGESWQLGVFLAHALAIDGRLAGPDEVCDQAVWATGAVDNDLRINAVSHVPEKIHLSQSLREELSAQNIPLSGFVPGDNLSVADSLSAGFVVSAAETASDILASLRPNQAVPLPVSSGPTAADKPQSRRASLLFWSAVAVASFAAASYFLVPADKVSSLSDKKIAPVAVAKPEPPSEPQPKSQPEPPSEPKAQPAQEPVTPTGAKVEKPVAPLQVPLRIGIAELRAPSGTSCAAIQFGDAKPVVVPLVSATPAIFPDSHVRGLCGLEFSIDADGRKRFARAVVNIKHGKFVRGEHLPTALDGSAAFEGRLAWRAYVPKRLSGALEYAIEVQTSEAPITASTALKLTASHRVTP